MPANTAPRHEKSRHATASARALEGVIVPASIASVAVLAGALLGIPVVIGGNGSSPAVGCGELALILDTIRTVESGGDYTAPPNRGGASGAYQYIDSTWDGSGGYESAYLAPPEVQDARAASDVQAVLADFGDVAFVPVVWYWPRAATDPSQLDIVPMPGAGNRLTVREYQTHWLSMYESKRAATTPDACFAPANADGYALPIDKALIDADPSMLDQPHHDYPAIDLMIREGTPVYAVRGGTVARISNFAHNCWRVSRCESTCGIGMSIDGDDGVRYIYCHGSRANGLTVGDPVAAGQLIFWSGDTGRSGAPHLHLEIKVNGEQVCPQPLLQQIYGLDASPESVCWF